MVIKQSQKYDDPDIVELFDSNPVEIESVKIFSKEDVLQIAIEELDGHLSRDNIFDLVRDRATQSQVRDFVNEITSCFNVCPVEYGGKQYRIIKNRRAYYLELDSMGESIGSDSGGSLVAS
jgi:hypothetical protein